MRALIIALSFAVVPALALAASPAEEKQFVDTYKKAYEAKDAKTLNGLLYTKGSDPQATEFYKMMMTSDFGGKVTSIQLVDLSAEDKKKIADGMKGPDGKMMKPVLTPVKKLVIKTETKDKNGSSTSSSETFVGEADGKLWIPVPGPAK